VVTTRLRSTEAHSHPARLDGPGLIAAQELGETGLEPA
jgi:hypothetical protein